MNISASAFAIRHSFFVRLPDEGLLLFPRNHCTLLHAKRDEAMQAVGLVDTAAGQTGET